ncbi:putative UDP-N-acetylglucosamine 2-epimerase [Peptoclostridium acidaminophilum DSM 3953]|uniref:UDP-N-acetylglucosamine 2-epimerase (non-hydrolyzing) n=1 Tax=Peptoclostridium acidaminophilum DSM 3953 TaxID=1286171 RepID=W8U405_PEPAC|nr:UDP-N-acetylglucosamine 2-epimerase (non-hydrolyzing) [Peptoclostridium acidaminophilum]AHM55686.1 putative UDP-N-acetylglucosamine 2-epimerase [Peptoclostridium acidaminophilum DSM 3953]
MKKKLMTVFGTRPEAIKMAPLVKLLQKNGEFEVKVCVTAQHRQMLDMVLELFAIEPDYDLDIMQHGQTITDITSRVIKGMEEVLKAEKPDMLLVHGDTTTTFASALAAFYQKVPVGHVEAGLRSGNKYSPYPEEMNRMLTTSISELHFAPTQGNRENLLKENIADYKIAVTGNTVIDALMSVIKEDYSFGGELDAVDFENKKVVLLTCHRRENWGEPMINIFKAVRRLVDAHKDVEVVFPIHMNPNIRKIAAEILSGNERIHIIEPLDYEPFANLISKCHIVMTDSGGIQEEAPALGKPVVVMRTETERPEAVEAGTVKIAGVFEDDVYNAAALLIEDDAEYLEMARAVNPYGNGTACEKINKKLAEFFCH